MINTKYYSNQLSTSENPSATIALTTGWTKKEAVLKMLSVEAGQRIAIAGQLYSKEGINYIVRNLFLNPHINFLVITGIDLSGSLKEFKSFLNGDTKDFMHPEIPQERIKEFVDYFSKHYLIVEIKDLESAIKNIDFSKLPDKWTPNPVDFPEHINKDAETLPSEKVGFRIEGGKVTDVWLKVLDRIMKFGHTKMSAYGEKQRELVDIITVVNNDDPDNPYLELPGIYFNKEDLLKYYPQMMTSCVFEGIEYTYGARLRDHDGINQIQGMIDELKRENYSRRAIAFTWNVGKDHKNSKSPCLDLIQALVQDDIVYLTAYFRSNDMFRAWPQNAYGLMKIQKEITEALGLVRGKLVVISCSAHIYERDFIEAQKMIDNNKSKLECAMDPRGNFVIELVNEEIQVKHVDSEGKFLQKFTGKTTKELRDQINRYVTDSTHGIYLGCELYRAEQALKNKTQFIQDS